MGVSAAQREKWAEIIRLYQAGELVDEIAERLGRKRRILEAIASNNVRRPD